MNRNENGNHLDQHEYPTLNNGRVSGYGNEAKWGERRAGGSGGGSANALRPMNPPRSNRKSEHYSIVPHYNSQPGLVRSAGSCGIGGVGGVGGDGSEHSVSSSSTSTVSTPSSTAPSSVSPPLQPNTVLNKNSNLTVDTGNSTATLSSSASNLIMPRQFTSSRYNTVGGGGPGGRGAHPKYQLQQRPLGAEDGPVLPLNRPVIPIDKLIKHPPPKPHNNGNHKQVSPNPGGGATQVILAPTSTHVSLAAATAATAAATVTASQQSQQQQQASSNVPGTVTPTSTASNTNVASPSSRRSANTAVSTTIGITSGITSSHALTEEQKTQIKKVYSFLSSLIYTNKYFLLKVKLAFL